MNYLSALTIVLGIASGVISLYEFIKKRSWRPGIAFSIAAVILLIAASVVANLPSPSGGQVSGVSSTPTSSAPQSETSTTLGQAAPTPTPTDTPTPIPTPVIMHNTQLSEAMIVDENCLIVFYVPAKDVVVNNQLLHADFLIGPCQLAFKLDGQQSLQLTCGVTDDEPPGDSYQLKVLRDNQELLTQVYTQGHDAIANEVGIQGVQILTLEVTGAYSLVCQDQLSY